MRYRAGVVGLGWTGWLYDVAERRVAPEQEAKTGLPPLRGRSYVGLPNSHAGSYAVHPRTQLVAGCELDQERLSAFGRHYGITALYTDYREMLEKESLDLVSISTTTRIRPEVTIAAAEAGVKGIYTEKPMAFSLEEADAMLAPCGERNVKLVVGAISVNHPAFGKAREYVERGEVGPLVSMVCTPNEALAQHNSFLYLVGSEADWVFGNMENPAKAAEEFDNEITRKTGFLHFRNGVEGAILGLRPSGLSGVTVSGEKGMISFHWTKGFRLWKEVEGAGLAELPWPIAQQYSTPHTYFGVENMVDCIEDGSEPRVSGKRVLHAMEIEIALRESYRRGRVKVSLPLEDRRLRLHYRSFR